MTPRQKYISFVLMFFAYTLIIVGMSYQVGKESAERVAAGVIANLEFTNAELHDVLEVERKAVNSMILKEERGTRADVINYIDEYYPDVPAEIVDAIATNIDFYSTNYFIPASLIVAVIEQESSFNPMARGTSGEIGLMQIHPRWWKARLGIEKESQLFGIKKNIQSGTQIIKWLLEETKGDLKTAVKKYNGGHIYPSKVYEKVGRFQLHRKMMGYAKVGTTQEGIGPKDIPTVGPRRPTILDTAVMDDKPSNTNRGNAYHVVAAGDTYGSIAKEYLGDVNKWKTIADANPYPETNIPIGVTIQVPM